VTAVFPLFPGDHCWTRCPVVVDRINLIIIGAIVSIREEWERPDAVSASSVCFLVLSGAATGLSWLCYYRALQLGPVSMVAPVDKLSVALAIGFGLVFLGEPLTWHVAVGGLLIVAGSVVILMA